MAVDFNSNININTGDAQVSLKSLREEIKNAKNEMLNADEGSKAYADALQKAADKTFQLREAQEKIRGTASDLGEILGNSNKVLAGVASGYAAAQGAIGLFGGESKELEKQLLKVQSVMAIASGIAGVEGMLKNVTNLGTQLKSLSIVQKSITALQWLWNAAMAANPIGLVIAGIVALGAAIYGLTKIFEDNTEKVEYNTESIYSLNASYATFNKTLANNVELMKAQGKSQIEIATYTYDTLLAKHKELMKKRYDADQNYTKEQKDEMDKQLAELGKNIEEASRKVSLQRVIDKVKLDADNAKNAEDTTKKNNDLADKAAEERKKQEEKNWNDYKSLKQSHLDALDDLLADDAQKKLDLEYKRQLEAINQLIVSEELKAEIILTLQRETAIKQAKIDEDNKKIYLDAKKSLTDEIANMNATTAQEQLDLETARGLAEIDALKITEQEKADLKISFAEKIAIKQKSIDEQRNKEEQEANQIKRDIAASGFSAISDIAEAFAGKSLAQQKKAFNVAKAAKIAEATINTYSAATGAYNAMAAIPMVGPALGAVAAGIAVAAGLANIKKIASAKFMGSGGGGDGGAGSGGAPDVAKPPSVPQQITPTRNQTTSKEQSLQNQPIKAYVVETDITQTQNNVNQTKKEASF